jgi:hypothetical protein
MAVDLEVSDSAINQHIRALKERLNVNSLRELADYYRNRVACADHIENCRDSACRKSHLPESPLFGENTFKDDPSPVITLHDAFDFNIEAPWSGHTEPQVVPGVLDGRNAEWNRGAVICSIVIGIFAAIIVALGAAQSITEAINSKSAVPQQQLMRPAN